MTAALAYRSNHIDPPVRITVVKSSSHSYSRVSVKEMRCKESFQVTANTAIIAGLATCVCMSYISVAVSICSPCTFVSEVDLAKRTTFSDVNSHQEFQQSSGSPPFK
jgi:hypothetical protein